jgi:hypothetical protein
VTTVEQSTREIIENKLLAALEENSGQVAIVATLQDLNLLIEGLKLLSLKSGNRRRLETVEFMDNLKSLREAAFSERDWL